MAQRKAEASQVRIRVHGSPIRSFGVDDSEPTFALAVDDGGGAQAMVALNRNDSFEVPYLVAPDGIARATLVVDGTAIDFEVEGARDEDSVDIHLVRSDYVRFEVKHPKRLRPCRARCYNGSVGDPCVDCERNGRTVRICC